MDSMFLMVKTPLGFVNPTGIARKIPSKQNGLGSTTDMI
jgi:hypothetical protein